MDDEDIPGDEEIPDDEDIPDEDEIPAEGRLGDRGAYARHTFKTPAMDVPPEHPAF